MIGFFKNKALQKLMLLSFAASCLLVPIQGYATTLEEDITTLEPLLQAIELIQKRSLETKTSNDLARSAIKGMLQSIDPYSTLLTEDELKELDQSSKGQFLGFGLSMRRDDGAIKITRVMENSPAKKAGLKRGDRILKMNGTLLALQTGKSPFSAVPRKIGSQVILSVLRGKQTLEFKLKMSLIPYPAVRFSQPVAGVCLVTVEEFQNHTADTIYNYLISNNPKVVILDLRDNPGGLVFAAVEMVEIFLKKGKILDLKDNKGNVIETYSSKGLRKTQHQKVAILLNKNSASAAEIFAGAMQDHRKATLIGEQSYGKARVQSVFPLGLGLYAKLSFAYYHTARGVHFDQIGLTPDIKIADSTEGKLYSKKDMIFQKSLEWAKEQLQASAP